MSSINFNQSAMVALDTLKGINKNLSQVQAEISTGKRIENARDNAAIWAISKVMSSDVSGFKTITDSLSLGSATVGVARAAAEQIEGLMEGMKSLIISAQDENQDRTKLQTDIDAKIEQVKAIAEGAQFNGLSLLKGEGTVSILSSLDRSTTGVTSSSIDVKKIDISQTAQVYDTAGTFNGATANGTLTGATQTLTLSVGAPVDGNAYAINLSATDADASSFDEALYETPLPHNTASSSSIVYVPREGDTAADIAQGVAKAFARYAAEQGFDSDVLDIQASGSDLIVTSSATTADDTITVFLDTVSGDHEAGGGLFALGDIDVTTDEGASAALADIEVSIQQVIDAAAEFGSAQGRIDTQMDFVNQLSNSLKAGISALTDTDMEEASARLQSLQVQQQLGVQALSIANSSPQAILSLFRS